MMRPAIPALLMLMLASACASHTVKTSEIDGIRADCSNVDQTIAMLTDEKENNTNRLKSGIQSVVPVSAAINIVTGNYKENVSIATGEWGKKVDAKLQELQALKARCVASGMY